MLRCNATLYFTRGARLSVYVQVCTCLFRLFNYEFIPFVTLNLILFSIVILLLAYTGKDPYVQGEVRINLYH